jgi:hypothetical protein
MKKPAESGHFRRQARQWWLWQAGFSLSSAPRWWQLNQRDCRLSRDLKGVLTTADSPVLARRNPFGIVCSASHRQRANGAH